MKSSNAPKSSKAVAAGPGLTPIQGETAKPRGTARLRDDSEATPARRNITLQVNADGSPKWETVTEKNRGAWREIVTHSTTIEALGLPQSAAEAGPPAAPLLPEKAAGALFDSLARLEAMICSWVLKVPRKECVALLAFTKEEKAELVPLLQLLAEKHIPLLAEKYGAEVAFAAQFSTMTVSKFEAVDALAVARKKPETAEPEPAAKSEEGRPN